MKLLIYLFHLIQVFLKLSHDRFNKFIIVKIIMSNFPNYYDILNISTNVSEEEIYTAYRNKISQFNNLPFLTEKMIQEIKLLKQSIYVLGDQKKKFKYDKKYTKYLDSEEPNIDNTKISDRIFSIAKYTFK